MVNVIVENNTLLITCGVKAIALNIDEQNACKLLEIPKDKPTSKPDTEEDDSMELQVVTADISSCGKWIVLCTSNKLVSLWKTVDWTIVSNRHSVRVASKVRFMPSGKTILLADKSGDAYSFAVDKPNEEGTLILGHLSMLLDILISPDEEYVITCDRDEKIRISRYPNTYNIQSYCLGHEEFITGLSFLPSDTSVLISSSGDGTLRFWNFIVGVQLYVIDCSGSVCADKHIIKDGKVDEECVLPVRHVTACSIDAHASLICSIVSDFQGCLVYQVMGDSKAVTADLVQVVRLQAEPWEVSLSLQGELWALGPVEKAPLSIFSWDSKTLQFVPCSDPRRESVVSVVSSKWELFQSATPTLQLPLLYKRKFDNIQVYQERKKQRLAPSCTSASAQ